MAAKLICVSTIYRGQVDTNNAMINANSTKNGVNGAEVPFNKEQPQIENLMYIECI